MYVKQRLGLMTGAAVAIFIVVTCTSFFSVANLIEDQKWLLHSRETISEFHNLLFRVSAAGSDERGFLLTERRDFITAYQDQVKQIKSSIARLKQLEENNPAQLATITELAGAVDSKLASYDATMELLATEGREAAFERVRSQQPDATLKIKNLEAAFEAEEKRLLDARHDELVHSVRSAQLSLLAGCLLSIAFVAAFNYFFGRHITGSIRRLLNAAENAEHGRFLSINVGSNDEFGELGNAFNQLSLKLDSLKREVESLDRVAAKFLLETLDQISDRNTQFTTHSEEIAAPLDASVQKSSSVFRNTSEVRRLLNTADENLFSLKQAIEECSEQADKLGGLQSELDNISNALEVISMSVDMTSPDGQPVLGAVMTRLHELSKRCHHQRETVGESLTRMQTLLSRAMLTAHASSGAETTGRQLLGGLTDTLDSLVHNLEQCRSSSHAKRPSKT
jgi:CHASE3 domain sensor protein